MELFPAASGANLRLISSTRIPRDDPEVLRIAAGDHRILVTHDFQTMPSHFANFLIEEGDSPGVFLVKQRTAIGSVVEALLLVWAA